MWEDESEFVNARSPLVRILRAVFAVVVLFFIGFTIYNLARTWFSNQLDPEGEPGAEIAVSIPAGATTNEIASILESSGVIPNSTFWRFYVQYRDHGNFQAGDYTMQENMSADESIAVLDGGPAKIEYGEFLLREGLWVSEILAETANQIPNVTEADLRAALDSGQLEPRYRPPGQTSWEGLLFPAKYFIEDDITPIEVLNKMNNEFATVTGELGYGGAERKHGLSAYEVIIIASLVEAEAKTDADRPKIARVIYNRLAQGTRIDIDATLIYGKGLEIGPAARREPLTRSDLDTAGPYNTRHSESNGLPPTPIAAPGRKSLEAAMNPVEGPWLFYVLADAEGNHAFFDNIEDFNVQKEISREAGLLG